MKKELKIVLKQTSMWFSFALLFLFLETLVQSLVNNQTLLVQWQKIWQLILKNYIAGLIAIGVIFSGLFILIFILQYFNN